MTQKEIWQQARFIRFEDERKNATVRLFLQRAGMTASDLWVRSERPREWECRQIDAQGHALDRSDDAPSWLSNVTNGRTGKPIVIAAYTLELQPDCREAPPQTFVLREE